MPDISLCQNHSCPLRRDCVRYMALPNPAHQSYASFKWRMGSHKCEYFWDVENTPYELRGDDYYE